MPQTSSEELVKIPKQKRNRSASALTPEQLARKRANDRKSQRALRAKRNEYIKLLEQELEDLRSGQHYNSNVQQLLCRNQALEGELRYLKGHARRTILSLYGTPSGTTLIGDDGNTSLPVSAFEELTTYLSAYGNNQGTSGPGTTIPPVPSDANCTPLSDYSNQYAPLLHVGETWAIDFPHSSIHYGMPRSSPSMNKYENGPSAVRHHYVQLKTAS